MFFLHVIVLGGERVSKLFIEAFSLLSFVAVLEQVRQLQLLELVVSSVARILGVLDHTAALRNIRIACLRVELMVDNFWLLHPLVDRHVCTLLPPVHRILIFSAGLHQCDYLAWIVYLVCLEFVPIVRAAPLHVFLLGVRYSPLVILYLGCVDRVQTPHVRDVRELHALVCLRQESLRATAERNLLQLPVRLKLSLTSLDRRVTVSLRLALRF